ncbi:MAG: hypothetical protein IJW96_05935 [Clostridia bacterium]|nr:hypothetical protein [Clostridia bacterium]
MNKLLRSAGVFNILSGILFIITYFGGSFLLGTSPTGHPYNAIAAFLLIVVAIMAWPTVCILPIGMFALGSELCKKQNMDWKTRGILLGIILVKGFGLYLHCGSVSSFFRGDMILETIFGVVLIITILVLAISILLDIPALFVKKNS